MIERKTFTFDGENSADYGLYISGDSVYNAPNREIDMVSIPGRNGQLAIDMGRYENITVTYPAFVIADTQAEFREKIRRIRNWLCSKTSYQRLTDDYNPESFRLGLYKSGLEVEPIFYNRCGEFEMSFDCQPQRFLFTGEEVFTLGEWGETETYSGSIVSFEGAETTAIKSLIANITPKQSGSGDPSPTNIRSISGWSEVNTEVAGKNLFNPNLNSGLLGTDAGTNDTTVTPSNRYGYSEKIPATLSCKLSFKTNDLEKFNWICVMRYIDGIATERVYSTLINHQQKEQVNIPAVANSYIRVLVGANSGKTVGTTPSGEIQIELGSTPTSYEPYNGTTYTTSLGQTVYGGTLDVVSGVLTLTKGFVDLGSLNWTLRTQWTPGNRFLSNEISNKKAGSYNILCSQYKLMQERVSITDTGQIAPANNTNSKDMVVRDDRYSDATAFKNAVSGVQLVYELATPTEIQLTPTQVTTLLGNNNIWADSGSVEVEIGENPYILVNPTKFEACPIFEVEGAGTLSIGDTTLTISNTGTTIIDTEMMEAYEDDNGAIISRNDDVEGGFPTLTSGINNVEADGLTSVKVTPKWWEL